MILHEAIRGTTTKRDTILMITHPAPAQPFKVLGNPLAPRVAESRWGRMMTPESSAPAFPDSLPHGLLARRRGVACVVFAQRTTAETITLFGISRFRLSEDLQLIFRHFLTSGERSVCASSGRGCSLVTLSTTLPSFLLTLKLLHGNDL